MEVEIRIEEPPLPRAEMRPISRETSTLFKAYALVRQLKGRLEVAAPAGGLLSITLRMPVDHSGAQAEAPLFDSPSPGKRGHFLQRPRSRCPPLGLPPRSPIAVKRLARWFACQRALPQATPSEKA